MTLRKSALDPSRAVHDEVQRPGEPWTRVITAGQRLRIVDLEGTQAVDTLCYDAHDFDNRYSAANTIRAQRNLFLTTGSSLVSVDGDALATIVADTCGRHDTVGGACSAESNTCRFGHHTRGMHNCRDNFLIGLARHGLGKRDLAPNINFFMNVPVTDDGTLDIVDGISEPGNYVELQAERDTLFVISNCPQLNNPCNGWNPTPIRLLVWDPGAVEATSRA
jgi:urea carboxylase-associated protein 1